MNYDGKNTVIEPDLQERRFAGSLVSGLMAFAVTFIVLRLLF
jgi:hypothetical protein